MSYPRLQIVALIALLPSCVTAFPLEDYDIRSGADPLGGSYLFFAQGNRFWSNEGFASGGTYEESDWDSDGDEEMRVTFPSGRNVAFKYYNDTTNGPTSDPFYSETYNSTPVIQFDYRNTGDSAVSLSLSVETGSTTENPLPRTSLTIPAGSSGIYSHDLNRNATFTTLRDNWMAGGLRLMLIQESDERLDSTVEYDNFRLAEPEPIIVEPDPLDIPEDAWKADGPLAPAYGAAGSWAWSEVYGWIWHEYFPRLYSPEAGWFHYISGGPESYDVLHDPVYGFLMQNAPDSVWFASLESDDFVDMRTGQLYNLEGGLLARSVPSEQPDEIPGNWFWATPILPDFASITARPVPDRPVYGLYCWANEFISYQDLIQDVGWTNFRVSGPMNDQAMVLYAQDGIEVMYTLAARVHGTFAANPMGDWRNRANYDSDEAFIEDYILGVRKTLQRYGPGGTFFDDFPNVPENPIRHIEIFNEPNFWYLDLPLETHKEIEDGWTTEEKRANRLARQQLYGKLLVATYDAIKAEWPSVTIVGFAAGGASKADSGFIEGVHESNPDVAESYDILSTHPYVTPVPPEARSVRTWGSYSWPNTADEIFDTMRRFGTTDRPVWYTELNWSIPEEQGGRYETSEQNIPAALQAAYYIRGYALTMRLGVERLFYMSVVDTDGVNAGMINQNGTWRPVAYAVENMIELMPHPRITGRVLEIVDQAFAYTFDPDVTVEGDHPVTMAWSVTAQGKRLPVFWDGEQDGAVSVSTDTVEVIDMYGNAETFHRSDGPLSVEIGPYPVYIRPLN